MYYIHMNRTDTRKAPKSVFVAATVVIFFLTLSAADSVGFVPYYIDGTEPSSKRARTLAAEELPVNTHTTLALSELPELGPSPAQLSNTPSQTSTASLNTTQPVRLVIPAISMDLPIQNPQTRDVGALDTLLQKGPARYVDSAKLGEKGNVIIFGHSSRLPIVHNQMYKAFNRISELEAGDRITVTGANGEKYVYAVRSVRKANAEDTRIDMSPSLGTRLTIVTCDTLTSKSSRFVMEAELIGQ